MGLSITTPDWFGMECSLALIICNRDVLCDWCRNANYKHVINIPVAKIHSHNYNCHSAFVMHVTMLYNYNYAQADLLPLVLNCVHVCSIVIIT